MIKFGTGGWRAVIADEFTKTNLRLLTAGLCRMMIAQGLEGSEVCVGYDRRFLSKESAHWTAEVLAGYGFHTYMINRSSPTPLIMFMVRERNVPYGMAITASHNPATYNGVKVFTSGGRDASPEVTDEIEKYASQMDPGSIPSIDYDLALQDGLILEDNPTNDYLDCILDSVDVNAIKKAHLRIGLDPLYGVSQSCLRTVLTTCRCDLEVIHDMHDTLFGGKLPTPTTETLIPLEQLVVDRSCDFGLATDGDADRIAVIDNNGFFVHPNQLLVLLYYYLVKYRGWKGDCVRNNSTTHLLDRVAEGFGQKCHEVPVGFKYVSAKMTETGAVIGGESSGGLTVRGHISGKDGIYAAALITEMVAVTGKSVSALYDEICGLYGFWAYEDGDIRVKPERKEELKKLIFEAEMIPEFGKKIVRIDRSDGCKVWFEDGSWCICRFSGTEPLLRFAAEAQEAEDAKQYIKAWKAICVPVDN